MTAPTTYSPNFQTSVNVRNFGAISDSNGSGAGTDASVAINAAIASLSVLNSDNGGATIFIPAGFWRLSHPIHVCKGITLCGAAAGNPVSGTVLVPDVGVQAIVTDFGDTCALGLYQDGSPLSVNTTSTGSQSFPLSAINVMSTTAFTSSGEVLVKTDQGFKPVLYTSKTPTSFTGLTASTTVAAGSDGVDLAVASVIHVIDTTGFPSSGIAYVMTDSGLQRFEYGGLSGGNTLTSILPLAGAAGIMHTGNLLSVGPAFGNIVASSAVVQGTPNADANWAVIKDLAIFPAGTSIYPDWTASTTTTIGTIVKPVAIVAPFPTAYNGFAFKCVAVTGDAKTGSVEPTWATIRSPVAALKELTIVDNHVTWQIIEYAHGLRIYEICKFENLYFDTIGGDGIHINADVTDNDVPSGANIVRGDYCRIVNCVGYGMSVQGGDSNASLFSRLSIASNTGGGIFEGSFLGNTYIQCHVADNYPTLNDYWCADANSHNLFLGCYSEGGNWYLTPSSLAIGSTNMSTSYGPGQVIEPDDSSPFQVTRTGTGVIHPALGEVNVNTILSWQNTTEDFPFRLRFYDGGSGATSLPEYVIDFANSTQYSSFAFTGLHHRESGNLPQVFRGIFIGPLTTIDSGYDSGPLLTNGSAAPSGVSPNPTLPNQWRIADKLLNYQPSTNGIESWMCVGRGGFTTTAWVSLAHHFGGDLVHPTTPDGFVFRALGSGYSGSSEPSWTTGIGDQFADGAIRWECLGVSSPTFAPEMFTGGRTSHDMASDADYTLGATVATAPELYASIIEITDAIPHLSTTRNIILPLWDGAQRTVNNKTLQSLIFKSASGTGVTVATTALSIIYCDGTNWVKVV